MEGFAPVFFDGHDAGSGPVAVADERSPITTAIHNVSTRHMHDIATGLPDNRQAIRAWRQQIQECMKHGHCQLFKFLVAGGTEPDILKRAGDAVIKYSKATWNFASSVRDLALDVDCSDDLGFNISEFAEKQKQVNRAYTSAAISVCNAEERLEEKLKRVDATDSCVRQLLELGPTPALGSLTGPARNYLESVYADANLEAEYTALIERYKRFAILKGLVSLGGIQQTPAPVCTICMTKEITHATIPCGHTYCEECSRTQVTSCYICRVQVRDRVRLFFS